MTMPHENSGLAEAPPYESDADKSDEEIVGQECPSLIGTSRLRAFA